jgi:hypothetical protein
MKGRSKLRDTLALAEAALMMASYLHYNVEDYEKDKRIGSMLLDQTGRLLVCRISEDHVPPIQVTMASVVDPHARPLPANHPRLTEDHERHERSYRRDDEQDRMFRQ